MLVPFASFWETLHLSGPNKQEGGMVLQEVLSGPLGGFHHLHLSKCLHVLGSPHLQEVSHHVQISRGISRSFHALSSRTEAPGAYTQELV